jgi:hypothetical protein
MSWGSSKSYSSVSQSQSSSSLSQINGTPCDRCNPNETPASVFVSLSGFRRLYDWNCPYCENVNGDYELQQPSDNPCIWRVDVGPFDCGYYRALFRVQISSFTHGISALFGTVQIFYSEKLTGDFWSDPYTSSLQIAYWTHPTGIIEGHCRDSLPANLVWYEESHVTPMCNFDEPRATFSVVGTS